MTDDPKTDEETQPEETQPEDNKPKLSAGKKRLFTLIIASFTFLVAFAFAEAFTRIYVQGRYQKKLKRFKSPFFVPLPGNPLQYQLAPSKSRDNKLKEDKPETWHCKTNELGLRGPLPAVEKTNKRLWFIGDSYTFGWGVNEGNTFCDKLAAKLKSENWEVFNGGVPGYNTIQELNFIKQHFERFKPDVICLGYVVNDAEPQSAVPEDPQSYYRFANSWFFERIKLNINRSVSHGEDTPLPINVYTSSQEYLKGFAPDSVKWRESKAALIKIAEYCNSKKIPFVVFIFPDVNLKMDNSYQWMPIHKAVSDWCKENKVPVTDIRPAFAEKDPKSMQVIYDGHPNAAAHAIFADIIERETREARQSIK